MKAWLCLLIAFGAFYETSPVEVTVDRIEDNNYAVIEVCYKGNIKMIDVEQEFFNIPTTGNEKLDCTYAHIL